MRSRLSHEDEARLAARMQVVLDSGTNLDSALVAALALIVNELSSLRQELSSLSSAVERMTRFK